MTNSKPSTNLSSNLSAIASSARRASWLAPVALALPALLGACADDPSPGAELEGSWSTPCYQGAQTRLTYEGLALTGTYTEYVDMACTTPRHIATWTGHAVVGAEVAPGVRKLDLAFDGFRSVALTAEEAALVNQNQYCGLTDWAPGVERDILGRDCYGFSIPVGGQSLDVYQVDGDGLLFGKGSKILVAPSESDRPAELDPMRPFSRS